MYSLASQFYTLIWTLQSVGVTAEANSAVDSVFATRSYGRGFESPEQPIIFFRKDAVPKDMFYNISSTLMLPIANFNENVCFSFFFMYTFDWYKGSNFLPWSSNYLWRFNFLIDPYFIRKLCLKLYIHNKKIIGHTPWFLFTN